MNDRFQFYSRSKPAAPGFGAGESLSASASASASALAPAQRYADLPCTFRQVLSNFSLHSVIYSGELYPSVEHAFHAAKILRYAPAESRDALAALFSQRALDTFNPRAVGLGGAEVKRAGGKRGLYCMTPAQCKDWAAQHGGVMEELLTSKFERHEDARRILLATGHAELWHFVRGKPPQHWTALERIRTRMDRERVKDPQAALAGTKRARPAEVCA